MTDLRFKSLFDLLGEYSNGHFGRQLPISEHLDDIDAFSAAINMLGEELQERTVSMDYFNAIFHSVRDMLFILESDGIIRDLNRAASDTLGYGKEQMSGQSIDIYLAAGQENIGSRLCKAGSRPLRPMKRTLRNRYGRSIAVDIVFSPLKNASEQALFILSARDRRPFEQMEKRERQAVMAAQEKDRSEWARDLHDSFGQQLSGVRLMLEALIPLGGSGKIRQKLAALSAELKLMQKEIRDICFRLMPAALSEGNLPAALYELARHSGHIKLHIEQKGYFPSLPADMATNLYRCVQEAVHNARHGRAENMLIRLHYCSRGLYLLLKDDGRGFSRPVKGGMGIVNIRNRLGTHGGHARISGMGASGSLYVFWLPIDIKPHRR